MAKEIKFRCKLCGQLVKPNPDGSCPLCGAPKDLLVFVRDQDDEEFEERKRR